MKKMWDAIWSDRSWKGKTVTGVLIASVIVGGLTPEPEVIYVEVPTSTTIAQVASTTTTSTVAPTTTTKPPTTTTSTTTTTEVAVWTIEELAELWIIVITDYSDTLSVFTIVDEFHGTLEGQFEVYCSIFEGGGTLNQAIVATVDSWSSYGYLEMNDEQIEFAGYAVGAAQGGCLMVGETR